MRISKLEKELLKQAFSVPAPKKKRAFLRTLPKQEVGLGTLILSQTAYIRKWIWAVSFLLFALAALAAQMAEQDVVWILSAVMPFAALLLILEFAKSSAYGMSELEMSSRFSLRTILLARMVMLGAVQMLGLLLTVPMAGMTLISNGVYLLVPYLLTALLGLVAVRRIRGKEGLFVCGSISAFVCVLAPMLKYVVPMLYGQENRILWVFAVFLLLVGLVKEYRTTINHWEEFVWN
ncbi:MAG: hypothetical protein J6J44_04800 [Lachnospiraceae bacterium]|nr:hypothetical protein [Lachnospiraceae bacterium]